MTDQTPEAVQMEVEILAIPTDAASTNFFWTIGHKETFNLQTTLRGNLTAEQIEAHFQMVIMALHDVVLRGGHAKQVGRAAEPIATSPAPQTNADDQVMVSTVLAAPATSASAQTPQTDQRNMVAISRLEVAPRADGRVDLRFFGTGHKYADITAVREPDSAVHMLSATGAWTPQHFASVAVYNVAMIIEWTPSEKKNSKGNPYKDIVAIRPA